MRCIDDVQSWWEIPSICYYCNLLGNAFGLPDFSVERLEEALKSGEEDVLLTETYTTLLRGIVQPSSENGNWRDSVSVLFSDHNRTNPFSDGTDKELTPWEKLDILYNLCELRLESPDVNGIIKTIEKWEIKVVPIGEDTNEMLYWYFCGTRIYMQDRSVDFLERKSARRSVKRNTPSTAVQGMNGMRKYAYETLLKLPDTPRSNLIKQEEGKPHWAVVTTSLKESLRFTAQFETSTEPEEETLYRNLAKVVIPKIRLAVVDQERRHMMAGERQGLTRSGRKVVTRYKNGFVSSNTPSEKPPPSPTARQSKRRRTQPPLGVPVRRSSRHNSEPVADATPQRKKGRTPEVRSTTRTTRRSTKLEEFTEPPSTDSDDDANDEDEEDEEEDEDEEDGKDEDEDVSSSEKNSDEMRRKRPTDKDGKGRRTASDFSAKKRGPGSNTIRNRIRLALELRDKDDMGKPKHEPTGDGDAELMPKLSDIMATLTRHPDAWQFNEAVNDDYAPYYYTLIQNPKDFGMIEDTVNDRQYKTLEQFVNDIHLVFTNCYDYNGPINEYTRAARVLEKYFRRLIKEFFRDEYTFDTHSVIHPGKRLFINRQKRIKALKLSGQICTPQKQRSVIDESSRDSISSAMRSPGGTEEQQSNDGSEFSTPSKPPSARRPSSSSTTSRRKKTGESEVPVSFTALLSESSGPAAQHGYHGYPPYYGYHGYYDPYRLYPPYPVENNAPTYIELSPRPAPKKKQFKNDEEPLLFPHLPKHPLPKPSLSADKISEELMLRDLNANKPSQINRIDSTTATPSETPPFTSTISPPVLQSPSADKKREADSTIQTNGDVVKEETTKSEEGGSNEAVAKKEGELVGSSEASPKKVEKKEQVENGPDQSSVAQSVASSGPQTTAAQSTTAQSSPSVLAPATPTPISQSPAPSQAPSQSYSYTPEYSYHPNHYSGYHYQDSYQGYHSAYSTGYYNYHPHHGAAGGGGYHPHPHHHSGWYPPHHSGYHYSAIYPPSPLLGEQALYVSRSKQITSTGRARGRGTRGRGSRADSGSPRPRGAPRGPRGRKKLASLSPVATDTTVSQSVMNGESPSGGEELVQPPTPPKDSKKQKKIFDIRIPPKKRVKS